MSTADREKDATFRRRINFTGYRFAVLYAEWNQEITHALRDGCVETLRRNGVDEDHIGTIAVPGSFELASAASMFARNESVDAVICLGCVIQGETRHFDFICQAVSEGLARVGMEECKPVIFGVLTTNTQEQARERAGGKLGNKGGEAALAALQMLEVQEQARVFPRNIMPNE